MPDVTVGAIQTSAYVDTGAGDVYSEPSLPRALELPFLGREPGSGGVHGFVANVHWLDALDLPGHRFLQMPIRSVPLPGAPDLGPSTRPRVILGGRALFDGSPVLDLDGETLQLRGSPVTPLEKIAHVKRGTSGATISKPADDETSRVELVRVPFTSPGPTGPFVVEISIGESALVPVLFDTGCPYVLRLSASGLRRAGLPTSRKAWLEREARMSFKYASAGGGEAATDLLVRLDEFALGAVRWRRPWVLLAGLGSAEEATELWYEGLLGAGAVFSFARFGLDFERNRLELEPGARVERASDNSWIVPDQGQYLGLQCEAGQVHSDPVLGSPRIVAVAADSPAARTGLQIGDRLLAIGGIPCALQIPAQINRELWVREGKTVTLTISREGRDSFFDVALPP